MSATLNIARMPGPGDFSPPDEDDLTSQQSLGDAKVLVDYWMRDGEPLINGCYLPGGEFADVGCFSQATVDGWMAAIAMEMRA